MRLRKSAAVLPGIVVAALLLAATGCGDGGDGDSAPTATAISATAGATITPAVATSTNSPPPSPTATSPAAATAGPTPPIATATTGNAPPAAAATPTSPAAPTATPAPSQVLITVRAFDLAFDRQTIHVPANATVMAVLQNDDEGVEHNLSFSLPGLGHGDTCKGPCTRTQTFSAPASGSFFFLCTLHDMSGTVTVDS